MTWHQWHRPVILAIWEIDLEVSGHPGQIVLETLSRKKQKGLVEWLKL
jgi:hypothetical protein